MFNGLPEKSTNQYDDIRRTVNNMLSGKLNVTGSFEISPNTTETVVTSRNVGNNSYIGIIGINSDSLTGNIFIKNKNAINNSFTIGHDSVEVARKYEYIILG